MRTGYCKLCGKQFETRSANKCYCSAECSKKANRQHVLEHQREKRARERQERKLELEKAKAKVNQTPALSMNATSTFHVFWVF